MAFAKFPDQGLPALAIDHAGRDFSLKDHRECRAGVFHVPQHFPCRVALFLPVEHAERPAPLRLRHAIHHRRIPLPDYLFYGFLPPLFCPVSWQPLHEGHQFPQLLRVYLRQQLHQLLLFFPAHGFRILRMYRPSCLQCLHILALLQPDDLRP